MAHRVAGRWRIVEMDVWDRESIDLVGPAFIEITPDGRGSFRFIAVEGFTDARGVAFDDRPAVEFSWDGNDEGDHVSGQGWARLEADGSFAATSSLTAVMTRAFGPSTARSPSNAGISRLQTACHPPSDDDRNDDLDDRQHVVRGDVDAAVANQSWSVSRRTAGVSHALSTPSRA